MHERAYYVSIKHISLMTNRSHRGARVVIERSIEADAQSWIEVHKKRFRKHVVGWFTLAECTSTFVGCAELRQGRIATVRCRP